MAKRRCAYEGSRYDVSHFAERSGFLVHVADDGVTPVEPAHEAVEGQLLVRVGDGYALANPVLLQPSVADRIEYT